jgi:segregation and condensation protein A
VSGNGRADVEAELDQAEANPESTDEAAHPEAAQGAGTNSNGSTAAVLKHKELDPAKRAVLTAIQPSLHTSQVVRHLLWHKAMVDADETTEKMDQYIGMVLGSGDGEHVSIRDEFHRDLAIAFELVIQEHLDPWNVDLSKFAEMYLKEAKSRGVDLVTAGRIILMAWTVLKLQSDEVADRAIHMQEPEEVMDWDSVPDWDLTDDEWDYTERIQHLPKAPIDEKIRHKGDRRVTLMELIQAFEEVHEEAAERVTLQAERLKARLSLKRRMRGRVGNMMHREDLEAEIQETWQRILDYPKTPIPFTDLVEADAMDVVQTFNALLFLVKGQRCTVTQENFPYGEIYITPSLPEAAALLEEVKA